MHPHRTQEQCDALADAIDLVSLFSNCIESLNLIHPAHEGQHSEELLLSQLEIQQSRLLIWGGTLGITSPPAITKITQAVPLHPGNWNPEPDKPTNFDARDPRLDDPSMRKVIAVALSAMIEPIREFSKTQIMMVYGLAHHQTATATSSNNNADPPTRDDFRLEAFREKHTLLRDVAASFPRMPKRVHAPPKQSWEIQDQAKFPALLRLVRENIDYLIQLMDVQPQVDRAMKLDVRAMGWHPSDDEVRITRDTWKLSLLKEASETEYPEYSYAAQEALDNIMDEWKGTQAYEPQPDHLNAPIGETFLHAPSREVSPERYADRAKKPTSGGLFPSRPKFMRMFSGKSSKKSPTSSGSVTPITRPSTPVRSNTEYWSSSSKAVESLDPPRSSSIHGDSDLARIQTWEDLNRTNTLASQISRHDQYPGLKGKR